MRYYIADLHFFHMGINDRMDRRGFADVEEMNEFLIKQWNGRIKRNDEVVVLGDLSLGKAEETNDVLRRLNGRIYLIRGNHDKWLKDSKADLSRFEWVKDYAEMSDNGRKAILCHYPIVCYNGQFRTDAEGNHKVYMLHGHIHRTQDIIGLYEYKKFVRSFSRKSRGTDEPKPAPCNIINCFCMFSNYVPLTLDEWIEIDKQEVDIKTVEGNWRHDE